MLRFCFLPVESGPQSVTFWTKTNAVGLLSLEKKSRKRREDAVHRSRVTFPRQRHSSCLCNSHEGRGEKHIG